MQWLEFSEHTLFLLFTTDLRYYCKKKKNNCKDNLYLVMEFILQGMNYFKLESNIFYTGPALKLSPGSDADAAGKA